MLSFTRKSSPEPTLRSCWHKRSALPMPPILQTASSSSASARVHWWTSDMVHVKAESVSSPYVRSPAHVFMPPSASIVSPTERNLTWVSYILYRGMAAPELESPVAHGDEETGAKAVRPLKRVSAITRRVGDGIRKRRSIEKMISRADMARGLGLMLYDRSMVPFEKEVEVLEATGDVVDPWALVRDLTDALEEC